LKTLGPNGEHDFNADITQSLGTRPTIDLASPAPSPSPAPAEDITEKLNVVVVPAPGSVPADEDATVTERLTLDDVVVATAQRTIGVRERPIGSNSGPEVNGYLFSVGLEPGESWCAAWLYSMFLAASRQLGIANPCPRTGGCLRMWSLADDAFKIAANAVEAAPSLLHAGMVAVEDHGKGLGHVALVTGPADPNISDLYPCISGNTNAAGGRSGDGVYSQHRRISAAMGFLDFSKLPQPPSVA